MTIDRAAEATDDLRKEPAFILAVANVSDALLDRGKLSEMEALEIVCDTLMGIAERAA